MGGGTWSDATYTKNCSTRAATGTSAFIYTDSGLGSSLGTHATLDPVMSSTLDGKGAVREARDSDEHPESVPIAVWFDVTGSMRDVPRTLQTKMLQLLGLLLRKGYVTDPQVLFAGIGDATCDRAPIQVGQFESDNRMEEHLGNLYLEGGGGGQMTESYELAMYFMSRHVVTDAWEKRGKRGYFFIIGDEMAYPRVKRHEVQAHIGEGTVALQEDIPLSDMVRELLGKWDTYYILPAGALHAGHAGVLAFWRDLLGQNVLQVDSLDAVPETIALMVGLAEGTTDLGAGLDDLDDVGSGAVRGTVGKALAAVGSVSAGGGAVVSAPPPGNLDAPSGSERL
jgi:hypothetical protein